MATDQVERTAVERIVEADRLRAPRSRRRRADLAIGGATIGPNQPSSMICSAIVDPRRVPELGDRRGEQVVGRTTAGVQPAEPSLAGLQRHERQQFGRRVHDVVADLDLAVVGGDQQHGPRRQHLEQVADQTVGSAQLGVVEVAEATLVGDLVDPAVVGVDEALARRRAGCGPRSRIDDDARNPTGSRTSQVRLGERR